MAQKTTVTQGGGNIDSGRRAAMAKTGTTPRKVNTGGLHDRLNRISHWDLNVSDADRSRKWYEKHTELKVVCETSSHQDFPSLGITDGRFRGWLLKDPHQAGGFPMIHLVEWIDPAPVGQPYLSQANVGWYRLCPGVRDVAKARKKLEADGFQPFAPTTDTMAAFHPDIPAIPYKVFGVHDPDGITLEYVEFDNPQVPVLIANNTADCDAHIGFYLDVLGLDFLQGTQTAGTVPNVYSPLGGDTELTGAFLGMRGETRTFFDWLQWTESVEYPTPYQEPTHLGIMRCTLEVDDLDRSYDALLDAVGGKGEKISLSEPEVWDFGPGFGAHRVINLTDFEGTRFQLIEQQESPFAGLHPLGDPFPETRKGTRKRSRSKKASK
ncbi:MAG: VOC family protein [Thermoleophilia bacterium]